jgi:hypothetical protein
MGKGVQFVVISAALMIAGCAPTYTNAKKMSREDVAIDVLECQKAAVVRYKAARRGRSDDETSYEMRQKAVAASRAAYDRCLQSRGWKKSG